jgi:hypothetical protein
MHNQAMCRPLLRMQPVLFQLVVLVQLVTTVLLDHSRQLLVQLVLCALLQVVHICHHVHLAQSVTNASQAHLIQCLVQLVFSVHKLAYRQHVQTLHILRPSLLPIFQLACHALQATGVARQEYQTTQCSPVQLAATAQRELMSQYHVQVAHIVAPQVHLLSHSVVLVLPVITVQQVQVRTCHVQLDHTVPPVYHNL